MPGLDEISEAIGELRGDVKGLRASIERLRTEQHTPLNCPLAGRVASMERWQWLVSGAAGVIGAILGWMANHLPFFKGEQP
jgi:hypothetical protein